jgi:hypothetical protein
MLKVQRNGGRNTAVKVSGQEIKEIDRKFVYLGGLVEKNGRNKNVTNEGIGEASECLISYGFITE